MCQAELGSLLLHQFESLLEVVLDLAVQNGFLHILLYLSDQVARLDSVILHHQLSGYRVLEVADGVLGFHVH